MLDVVVVGLLLLLLLVVVVVVPPLLVLTLSALLSGIQLQRLHGARMVRLSLTLTLMLLAVLMQWEYGGFSGSIPYHCDNYAATVVVNGTCPEHLIPISCNEAYPEAFVDKPECMYCSVFGLHTR